MCWLQEHLKQFTLHFRGHEPHGFRVTALTVDLHLLSGVVWV